MTSSDNCLLSIKEVADYLGVSKRTVHNYMRLKRNPLPYSKPAGKLFFWRKDLEQWLENK
jgi:excisionase family DNA binding protein